jgi:hypothetical protein
MSDITITTIDENFPIAGQNNDSQGFRDNFNQIKSNLGTAKAEITALEDNTAKINLDNNFNGNEIQDAILINVREKAISQATATSIPLHWTFGQYQKVTCLDDLTLTLTSWPESGSIGKMRIEVLSGSNDTYNITWATTQGNNIKYTGPSFLTFTVSSPDNPKIFDFWTIDGGSTVFAQYIGEFVS